MAEKDYAASKLINLHSADGTTLLIPKIPLSTVDNNAYTVVVDKETSATSIVTKGAGSSLQAAVQAEIAAAVADSVVGNYVPFAEDGSSVEIQGKLDVADSATFSGFTEVSNDLAVGGYIEVGGSATIMNAATLNSTLDVAGAATFSSNVTVQGKLTVAQEYKVGELTSVRQAEVATQNYVQTYVADQIAGVPLLSRKIETDATIIATAPTEENLNIIYMIPQGADAQTGKDIYDEYMAFEAGVDDEENTIYKWQLIGNTDVDLSGYYTSAEVDQKLGDLADAFAGSGLVTQKYVDDQDAATSTAAVTAANGYTDAQIAAALTGLPEGSKLVAYIDAQDDAHLGSANKYTDDALANYLDKDDVATSYVPFAEDGSSVDIAGSLTVVGVVSATDDVGIDGQLDVAGAVTLHGMLDVHDKANLSDALAVTGSATLKSTLDVAGAATMQDTLAVTGKATLSGDVQVGSAMYINTTSKTVKVYDEWQVPSEDGSSTVTSTGLAKVATEHDISSIVQALDKTILYDVLEDEQI